jgi:hypothetical protein
MEAFQTTSMSITWHLSYIIDVCCLVDDGITFFIWFATYSRMQKFNFRVQQKSNSISFKTLSVSKFYQFQVTYVFRPTYCHVYNANLGIGWLVFTDWISLPISEVTKVHDIYRVYKKKLNRFEIALNFANTYLYPVFLYI